MASAKHTDTVHTVVEPPVFETSRVRLRPWRDTDGPGAGQGPDSDSLRFMPAGPNPVRMTFPSGWRDVAGT